MSIRLCVGWLVLCLLSMALSMHCRLLLPSAGQQPAMVDCTEMATQGPAHGDGNSPSDCAQDQCFLSLPTLDAQPTLAGYEPLQWLLPVLIAWLISQPQQLLYILRLSAGPPDGRRIALYTRYCVLRR